MTKREQALASMRDMMNGVITNNSIELAKKSAVITEVAAKNNGEKNPLLEGKTSPYPNSNKYTQDNERDPFIEDIGERLARKMSMPQEEIVVNSPLINEDVIAQLMSGKKISQIKEEMNTIHPIINNPPVNDYKEKSDNKPQVNFSNRDLDKIKSEIMEELKKEFKDYIKEEIFNTLTYDIFSKDRQKSILKEILQDHKSTKK